ncbi:MAG: DUF4026 domain-containing protein [Oscillospiraceae bacterium]|nr:DUF4026 domain-containing protein [Oscillospiraceae bacterium]
MFDAEKYIAEYQELEHGAPRLRAIRKAIQAADEAHNDEWSFRFRERCLNESTFESDDVDALIIFPEMVAIYDRNEELQADDEYFYSLMWSYKLVIENAQNFYHVPLNQIEAFLEDFRRRLEQAGRSLRTYYYMRENISEQTGNLLPAEEYGKYRDYPTDDLKDCTACETSHDVRMALLLDQPERAREIGKPIFSGEQHCGEVPETTYAAWIEYDMHKGDFGDARKLAKRLYPMVRHRMDMLREVGTLLHLYSLIDFQTGTTVFRHELRNFLNCRNHWMRFHFAAGAHRLFAHMSALKTDTVGLVLPQEFPLWNETHRYETKQLSKYFYEEAKTLAEKLDARNGNTVLMDYLDGTDLAYEKGEVDYIHGDTEPVPSVIGAVCTVLPDELTVESVTRTLENDGRFAVVLAKTEPEQGLLAFQIAEGGTEEIYQLMLVCQPVPPVQDFRPASPVSDDLAETVTNAEGVVLCIMPFEEKQPDLALHFQLKLLNLLFPGAVAFLDFSRRKLLPAGWVAMEAHSDVPPLVDYLYNLQLHGGSDSDALWIRTEGLRCCGIREIEILDATKQNFPRYCDMLCFAAERILLRGELSDAKGPFEVVRKNDGSSLICTWVPASEAKADYPADNAGGMAVRMQLLGDEADDLDDDAVLYLHDGEAQDGTQRRKRLDAITEDEFNTFCYGSYIATSRKIAALAKERYGILTALLDKAPENAYVCVIAEVGDDSDEIWVKVVKAEEHRITGTLAEDCIAGKAGDIYETAPEQLTDFSVRLDENLVIHPNTAYIALEIE